MSEYSINKGVGRSVEYKGLKAQYLFIFVIGLLSLFVLFVIMYVAGIPQGFCIGFAAVSASALVWLTFRLNAKFGQYGLMKLGAVRYRPRYIGIFSKWRKIEVVKWAEDAIYAPIQTVDDKNRSLR